MTVDGVLLAEFVHHDLGNLIAGAAPDIHDLVVSLALRNQTVGVLGLDFFYFSLSRRNNFILFSRNKHVVGAEGNAGTSRQCITILH